MNECLPGIIQSCDAYDVGMLDLSMYDPMIFPRECRPMVYRHVKKKLTRSSKVTFGLCHPYPIQKDKRKSSSKKSKKKDSKKRKRDSSGSKKKEKKKSSKKKKKRSSKGGGAGSDSDGPVQLSKVCVYVCGFV